MLRAKDVLEAAIDAPVILYSAPGKLRITAEVKNDLEIAFKSAIA